ncbi:MAG TPA: YkgJ family cysteine cluster protein [Desulfuromonadales bacterium]|nr:YkgJ family cysteine cluster protein [Desulfuromonadales bacterium]
MNDLLDRYGALLREVDVWFQRCLSQHSELIACRNGCSECCRGLFDITLLDALYLKRGFNELPEPLQGRLVRAALLRLEPLSLLNPAFVEPWLLNGIPERNWDALMPEEDETPCLLLSETGGCLVYQYRPMTCRLNGIPLIDVSGEEMFDEWCTMNFTEEDPRRIAGLRFEFTALFSRELLLFQKLIHHLTGTIRNEVDMFIPAAVVLDCNIIVEAIKHLDR